MNQLDVKAVNTIRCLAADTVQKANSGHPGMPMGMAGIAYVLFAKLMKFDATHPAWLNRDRFVLSAGHGSALLYVLMHLFGNAKITLDELKQFRQLGSHTPGHPEYDIASGVEVTTGPLGQGLANAVGLAMAGKYSQAFFNTSKMNLIDHKVYAIAGDGCMQEGISGEASSLAGHLKLDNLTVIYDSNAITIDGSTSLSSSEDVAMRYQAYGWETVTYSGELEDLDAIEAQLTQAVTKQKAPLLFIFPSVIGFGSPSKAGTKDIHGSPLGEDELKKTKAALGMDPDKTFWIDHDVKTHFADMTEKNKAGYNEWKQKEQLYAAEYPEKYALLTSPFDKKQTAQIDASLPTFDTGEVSTRVASGKTLDALMPLFPTIIGGSADLTPSNNTRFVGADDFSAENFGNRYIRYGIREHAMAAVNNAISIYGTTRAFGATFLCFSDYARPALRLAALAKYPAIFIGTHDSIGLGEDGPTHQPVEHLEALRCIPGLKVLRPADANETALAWKMIICDAQNPYVLVLTRQNLPVLAYASYPVQQFERGGYTLVKAENPAAVLISSGSEVAIALEAQRQLSAKGISVSVVSMPCRELFEQQPQSYRNEVIPPGVEKRVVVEAGVCGGWHHYLGSAGVFIGMTDFGASAPYKKLYEHFGITAEAVVKAFTG